MLPNFQLLEENRPFRMWDHFPTKPNIMRILSWVLIRKALWLRLFEKGGRHEKGIDEL
jgi:hypothetical protein